MTFISNPSVLRVFVPLCALLVWSASVCSALVSLKGIEIWWCFTGSHRIKNTLNRSRGCVWAKVNYLHLQPHTHVVRVTARKWEVLKSGVQIQPSAISTPQKYRTRRLDNFLPIYIIHYILIFKNSKLNIFTDSQSKKCIFLMSATTNYFHDGFICWLLQSNITWIKLVCKLAESCEITSIKCLLI